MSDQLEPPTRVAELLRDGARCDRTTPLWRAFLAFHAENPHVYDRLREIVLTLRARGFRRYSTKTIVAAMRFEWDLKTGGEDVTIEGGEERRVKLNDNHTPYFARMLIEERRELWDFFELRAADGDPVALTPTPTFDGNQSTMFGGGT